MLLKTCRLASGVATGGGKRGNLPPTSDRTPREIDANPRRFLCKKNRGRFTGFAPTFYMHRRYGVCTIFSLWSFFGLTITKKERVGEVVEGLTLVGPQ